MGVAKDEGFQSAYWKAFERVFGGQSAPVVKLMLLDRVDRADTGDGELDRVCFGLRQTMGWLAEIIEREALKDAGYK